MDSLANCNHCAENYCWKPDFMCYDGVYCGNGIVEGSDACDIGTTGQTGCTNC